MQCSSRSNCEIYETVFRSRLHSNTIACQRIGISRPCGNTHAETYRISRLSGQFHHVLNMTVPRKIGTLLHMQPGIKTCLIRNELVSEHRATAVTFGIHITVHRRDQSRDISWAACAAKPIDTMRKHMMPIRIVQTVRRSLQRIHIVILLAIKLMPAMAPLNSSRSSTSAYSPFGSNRSIWRANMLIATEAHVSPYMVSFGRS
mgnify:FL=1